MCKIGEIGDLEIREVFAKLCENGILKDKYKIIKKKGLTCALAFLKVFKVELTKIVLSQVHDMKLWLKGGPVKINKETIHQVTIYPILDREKMMRCTTKNVVEE